MSKKKSELFDSVVSRDEFSSLLSKLSESDKVAIESIVKEFLDPIEGALEAFEKIVHDPKLVEEFLSEANESVSSEKTKKTS